MRSGGDSAYVESAPDGLLECTAGEVEREGGDRTEVHHDWGGNEEKERGEKQRCLIAGPGFGRVTSARGNIESSDPQAVRAGGTFFLFLSVFSPRAGMMVLVIDLLE